MVRTSRLLLVLAVAGCEAPVIPEARVYTGADFAWVRYYGYEGPKTWTCREVTATSATCVEEAK